MQKSCGMSQVSKILIGSSRSNSPSKTDFQKNTTISSFSVSHHTGFCIGGTWSDWKKMRVFLLYVNWFQVSVSLYDEVHNLSAYLLEQQISALKKEEINKLSKVSKNWTFSLRYLSELFFCLCCFISCQYPYVHTSLWLWYLEQRSWHASETRQNWIWLIFGDSQSLWRPECWISPYFLTFNFCLFQHILIFFPCYALRSYLFFRATFLRQICISSFNLFGWFLTRAFLSLGLSVWVNAWVKH